MLRRRMTVDSRSRFDERVAPIVQPRPTVGDARSRLATHRAGVQTLRTVDADDAHRQWQVAAQLKRVRGDRLEWRLH